jgi:hypothetical protein
MIAENIKRLTDKGVLAAYADEQYKKLQREEDQYISLDEYCAKRGIE